MPCRIHQLDSSRRNCIDERYILWFQPSPHLNKGRPSEPVKENSPTLTFTSTQALPVSFYGIKKGDGLHHPTSPIRIHFAMAYYRTTQGRVSCIRTRARKSLRADSVLLVTADARVSFDCLLMGFVHKSIKCNKRALYSTR
jgi:hypothetical protein